jgi:hypothetical protein
MPLAHAVFYTAPAINLLWILVGLVLVLLLVAAAKKNRNYVANTDQRLCKACGTAHPHFARFCRRCGKNLAE